MREVSQTGYDSIFASGADTEPESQSDCLLNHHFLSFVELQCHLHEAAPVCRELKYVKREQRR